MVKIDNYEYNSFENNLLWLMRNVFNAGNKNQ